MKFGENNDTSVTRCLRLLQQSGAMLPQAATRAQSDAKIFPAPE